MARERRVLRLQQLILEIVAVALQREAADPRLQLASITRVKLTSDLSHAQVWWSCLAKEPQREKTAQAIEGFLPLLQARVAQQLGTRITPRLELKFDPTLERAQRLESIFHHLQEERGPEEEEGDIEDGNPEDGTVEERDASAEPDDTSTLS